MNLTKALRLDRNKTNPHVISLVGAGGKTTALFNIARELLHEHSSVFVGATSHLGAWQTSLADHHITPANDELIKDPPKSGITLFTGEIETDRTKPLDKTVLNWLREYSKRHTSPLLIEADGSRQKPLKAPDEHEPPIPDFTDIVIVVSGLTALGKPLSEELVHRSELFASLSGLQSDQIITPAALIRVLLNPNGGLKNIPVHARRVALLNQADTPELQSIGGSMATELLDHFDSVVVGTLHADNFQTFERCAAVILAAGEATRFGSPKQLLDWKGKAFVRHVAETALQAGLWPVQVVAGFHSAEIESALRGLPVNIVQNPDYQQGQSTSIRAGLRSLPQNTGSVIFLLADQPQIPVEVIRALKESHSQKLQPILAPLVLEERRANPVLFDQVTFPDLLALSGDVGGRAIFNKYHVEYLPWHDDILLFDVDTPQDYQRLQEME